MDFINFKIEICERDSVVEGVILIMSQYYDLMYEIYMTGNLAQIETYLQSNPNMDGVTVDDIWQAKLDENPHFEDEYGFFMHMEAAGTLISLAMMARYQTNTSEVIELLVKYGARVDHLANMKAAISLGKVEVLECLYRLGATLISEHVLSAFQCCCLNTIEWLYGKEVRPSRSERDILLAIIEERGMERSLMEQFSEYDETIDKMWDWYQLFTKRVPVNKVYA